MKLYHVSHNLMHNGCFNPKVPTSRLKHEDSTISRVCFSATIEGCLSAMPNGGDGLDEMTKETNGVLRIFEIDTDDFCPDEVISPDTLVSESLVPDARINEEYWITRGFRAKKSYLIQIHSYKTKKVKAKERWQGETVYFSTHVINNLSFSSSQDRILEVYLPYPGDEEMETFLTLIEEMFEEKVEESDDDFYYFEKNREEALYLAANYGNISQIAFQTSIGGYMPEFMSGYEECRLWKDRVIFRDIIVA